jgi:hypothetical protein
MRLSKDKTSWKAGGILRRDFRHTRSSPEIEKPRSSKDTKRWCRGKVGALHVKKWLKSTKYTSEWWDYRCGECGKVFDIWMNSQLFPKPKPKEIELIELNDV